ncbi:hypothetical protein ASD04_00105 [Devosia sp. Root436]|nr:hypothetical protein ASD04_00105 [Devosia sp. Root436]
MGQEAVEFIESLILPSGDPFLLIREQERIVRKVFGDVDPVTGRRKAQTVYLHLPSGSAKSTLAAACALLLLCHPSFRIQNSQLVIAAATREQARSTAFGIVEGFIRRRYPDEVDLAGKYRVVSNAVTQEIEHLASGSTLKVTSRSPSANEGQTLLFILAEETHAWTRQADRLWDVLLKAQAKITATTPLAMVATTAGQGVGGIGHRLYTISRDIASGKVVNPSWLPVIYEASADDDWRSPEVWKRVTFGLGKYKSLDVLRNLAMIAETSATARAEFLRYHLNSWLEGVTEPWIDAATYDDEDDEDAAAPFTLDDVAHLPCYIGLDASQTDDLTCVSAVFHDEETGCFYVVPTVWCPAESIQRRTTDDGQPYAEWAESGDLIATEGNSIDETVIEARIRELYDDDRLDIRRIGYDRYGVNRMMTRLHEDGLPVLDVPQRAWPMSPAAKFTERLILDGKLRHGGHPVLRWAFLNVPLPKPSPDGNIRLSKKDRSRKIDPAVATVIAIALCAVVDNEKTLNFEDLTGRPSAEA